MSLNDAMVHALPAMHRVAKLDAKAAPFERKLLTLIIDPLLVSLDLVAARGLRVEHGDVLRRAIAEANITQLKAVSKRWNPNRDGPLKDASRDTLYRELCALLDGSLQPTMKSPRRRVTAPAI